MSNQRVDIIIISVKGEMTLCSYKCKHLSTDYENPTNNMYELCCKYSTKFQTVIDLFYMEP